jgi:DNA mismatch endonuclease (patch repair protein)
MVVAKGDSSWASSEVTRRVMQSNRGRDTGPELRLRRLLHAEGLRYRVGLRPALDLRRTIDIAFTKQRVAVFVDGCFWHGCPTHSRSVKTNTAFWNAKIARNIARDLDTDEALRVRGRTVLRFWEHVDPEISARQIAELIHQLSVCDSAST